MKQEPIDIQSLYIDPVAKVWKAITVLEHMKRWYFDNIPDFRPEPGFTTRFNIHHEGKDFLHIWKITEVAPMKKISYEWRYEGYPGNSVVTFELVPVGDSTNLTLTHDGLETFKPELHPEMGRTNFLEGWTSIGSALKKFVEE